MPEIRSSATRTTVGVVIWLSKKILRARHDQAQQKAECRHQGAEHVEEDERVKVADHVLLLHPPPEALEQQPRDPGCDRADPNPGALPHAVDRPRRHVTHARRDDVEVHEHVVRKAVAAVDPLQVEALERRERERRVARLRVGDMPIARGDLRQQREHRVAEVAAVRDQRPRLARDQPVRLRVVDLASRDRRDEADELGGVHLVVTRHHARHVDQLRARAKVAGHDRCTDTTVPLVDDHLDTRIADGSCPCDGLVGRGVVDDDDPIDEVRDPSHGLGDEVLLLVRGNDDGDTLALDHWRPLVLAPRVPSLQEGVGDRGTECSEQQSDQPADRRGVAPARRRRLRGDRGLHDLALLDVLGEREQLLVLEQLLLDGSTTLLGRSRSCCSGP